MPKDNIIKFPDRMGDRGVDRLEMIENRIAEIETENDFIDSDIEYLQGQLEGNFSEVAELFQEVEKIHKQALDNKLVEFKSEFGVDIDFDADFDLTPEDK